MLYTATKATGFPRPPVTEAALPHTNDPASGSSYHTTR